MNAYELASALAEQGVSLSASDGKIKVRGPKSVLTAKVKEDLSAGRQTLLNLVDQVCCECGEVIEGVCFAWWTGKPVHESCGDAAFRQACRDRGLQRRKKTGEALEGLLRHVS